MNLNRREFITGAIAAGAAAKADKVFGRERHRISLEHKEEHDTLETLGYEVLYNNLTVGKIQFVTSANQPIGEPVSLTPLGDIAPGEFDERGILSGALNDRWLDAQREELHKAHPKIPYDPKRDLPRQINVIDTLRAEILRDSSAANTTSTFMDVVRHYADQEVIGGKGLNRVEYIKKHVRFDEGMPGEVQRELRRVLPGLAAQESHFNNNARSAVGARGIFQFVPVTSKDLGYSEEDMKLLVNQVEAAGKYFDMALNYFDSHIRPELIRVREEYFAGDKEKYRVHFLTPLLINAYNAGPGRMERVVRWVASQEVPKEKGSGFRAFTTMVEGAQGHVDGFGNEAAEYVPRVYALARLLADF